MNSGIEQLGKALTLRDASALEFLPILIGKSDSHRMWFVERRERHTKTSSGERKGSAYSLNEPLAELESVKGDNATDNKNDSRSKRAKRQKPVQIS